MKQVALFCGLIAGLLVAGCETTRPPERIKEAQVAAAATAQPSPHPDPAANGGASLPASTPYDGGGTTVTQNVNPVPFVAGSPQASGTASAPSSPNALTSRADGTMSGSSDQPAASTTWGTQATNWYPSSGTAPATQPQGKKKK
ncbi:MAG TPA: hypothetical protein VKE93_10385 [Candidatus Angelobacter sp.]|nr:hypothetical protein [Candidatus Angelobacter sp.]